MNADKYCVFRSGPEWYALPALAVRYVAEVPKLYDVPQTDAALAGVCHLRNEFLAVVHLDVLRGAAEPSSEPRQLIVVNCAHGSWGLLVEQVSSLEPLDSAMSAESDRGGFADAVIGAATRQGEFVRLLEPNRLYQLAEQRLRAVWNAGPALAVNCQEELS